MMMVHFEKLDKDLKIKKKILSLSKKECKPSFPVRKIVTKKDAF